MEIFTKRASIAPSPTLSSAWCFLTSLAQNRGTTVIATIYEANSDKITAVARATNRNRLTPYRKTTGKNTIDVAIVAASTASATSLPPFSAATSGDSPISKCRKIFSSTITELSINRENANASPPSTMVLTVPPPAPIAKNAARAESGIDKNTAAVARTLPRNSRIINPVRTNPIPPSWIKLSIAVRTKIDWSNTTRVFNCFGMSTRCISASLIPSTTAIVLVSPPCFRIGRYTEGCPSTRTMLV